MNPQFMLSDLLKTFEAVLVSPVIVVVPGYVLGWVLDTLIMRRPNLLSNLI
jgi:hypothetical protein